MRQVLRTESKSTNTAHYRYGPTRYPYEFPATPVSPGSWKVHIELYPRRLRIYPVSSTESLPPVYITVSADSPLSFITDRLALGHHFELVRVDIHRGRPWGDTRPLTITEYCHINGEKTVVLGAKPTEADLRKTIEEASFALQDSLVAIAPGIDAQNNLESQSENAAWPGWPVVTVGSKGLFNMCVS